MTTNKTLNNWLIASAIAIFVFIVFSPALDNDFVRWDDDVYLLDNQNYRGLGIENLKWIFLDSYKNIGMYIPLSWLTWSADYVVWGMNPFGYHLTNIIIHSLGAGLFYFLAFYLLSLVFKDKARDGPMKFGATFAALFWAIHPLRVESVVWITERKDVLCGFFFILTLLSYIYYTQTNKRKWYWFSLGLAICALLAKPIAVTIPLVLLLLDFYPLNRIGQNIKLLSKEAQKIYLEKIPFFILSLTISAFTLWSYYNLQDLILASTKSLNFGERILIIAYGSRFYLEKMIFPVHLAPLYEIWGTIEVLREHYIFEFSIAITLLVIFVSAKRRFPAIFFTFLFFIIAIFPVSGIAQAGYQIAADRFTYIPSMGVAIFCGGFLVYLLSNYRNNFSFFKNSIFMVTVIVLIVLYGATRNQESTWKDSGTMWKNTVLISPKSSIAHFKLGDDLLNEGYNTEAFHRYQTAFSLNQNYQTSYLNLAGRFVQKGMFDEAEWFYKSLIQTFPSFEPAWVSLGGMYFNQGFPNKAIGIYELALRINPQYSLVKEDLEKVKGVLNYNAAW